MEDTKHLDISMEDKKISIQTLKNMENLTKARRQSNNSTCSSSATTLTTDNAENLQSCGSICVYNLQQKLVFNCEFCDLKYGDLDNFRRHLHESHNLFLNSDEPEDENAKNSRQSARISNIVKKEPLEPPIDLPPSYFSEPLVSCGNIFVLNQRKFLLACGYCDCGKYDGLEMFEKHIKQQHNILEGCHNELGVVPKVEKIKEEVFIITEVPEIKEEVYSEGEGEETAEVKEEFLSEEEDNGDELDDGEMEEGEEDDDEEAEFDEEESEDMSVSSSTKRKLEEEPSTSTSKKKKIAIKKTKEIMSFSDLLISQFLEDEDQLSEVEDDNIGPDFCIEESDNINKICIEYSESNGTDKILFEEIRGTEEDERVVGENVCQSAVDYFYGKNGFKWSASEPTCCSKNPPLHNIVHLPGATLQKSEENLCGYWSRIFDSHMEKLILEHTNTKLQEKYNLSAKIEATTLDEIELRAFFGILIYTSVFKSNHESTKLIFATDGTGREIFRSTMSEVRFRCILSCLRFDNVRDRQQRLLSDPLAAVSEIFNKFIENCQKSYSIGTHACINEMLVPFRARGKFKICKPKKPAKYGIKLMTLTDARTHYLANAYINYGKNSDGDGLTTEEKRLSEPTQAVLKLCKKLEGSGSNITADNRFSSLQLVEELKKRHLTYLGTLKGDQKEIPPEFQPNKNRLLGSCMYGFTNDVTILSYVPRQNRAVVLLSSMHHKKENDKLTLKPAMLADYDNTKGGMDELDKKCTLYTCSRYTSRWSLALFYRILDISALNAYVIFQSSKEFDNSSRGDFLKKLARQMVLPHLQRRQHNQRLSRSLRDTIGNILGPNAVQPPPIQSSPAARKLCYICPSSLKRKTTHICLQCSKPMCMGCSKRICVHCANTEFDE